MKETREAKIRGMLDEKGELRPDLKKSIALWSSLIGVVVWGGFTVAAGVMLVGLGLRPWVVWPFAFYWWTGHCGRAAKAYTNVVKPQKWEQNVTVNVTAKPTAERISEAASRAVNERLTYGL